MARSEDKFGAKNFALDYYFYFFQMIFQYTFKKFGGISHNVPAVYDGLAALIRKSAAFPGPTKCGGGLPWE
jgi:hypothetical protein